MKAFLKILFPALALGIVSVPILHAEDDAGPPPGPPPSDQPPPRGGPGGRGGRGGRGGMMDPAQRIRPLVEALNLTDDQKTKITAIFKADQDQMQALRGGETPRDEVRAKMQDIQKSTHDQIRALLTEDQQQKFDAMPAGPGRGGRGGPGGRRRGGPGGPGGPNGPAGPGDAGAPAPAPAP